MGCCRLCWLHRLSLLSGHRRILLFLIKFQSTSGWAITCSQEIPSRTISTKDSKAQFFKWATPKAKKLKMANILFPILHILLKLSHVPLNLEWVSIQEAKIIKNNYKKSPKLIQDSLLVSLKLPLLSRGLSMSSLIPPKPINKHHANQMPNAPYIQSTCPFIRTKYHWLLILRKELRNLLLRKIGDSSLSTLGLILHRLSHLEAVISWSTLTPKKRCLFSQACLWTSSLQHKPNFITRLELI